jgi:hypothetical protein
MKVCGFHDSESLHNSFLGCKTMKCSNACQQGKSDGRGIQHALENNIKIYFRERERETVDCIHLTQDRVQGRDAKYFWLSFLKSCELHCLPAEF